MQTIVEIGETVAKIEQFILFLRWQLSAILELWGKFWDDPQREFGGVYHCAKFGWNCISRLNISRVWPDNAYSRPLFGCFGGENSEYETFCIVIPLGMQ